jgi:hypothetical protein
VKIELLWVPGCANVDRARLLLREVAAEQGVADCVREVVVETDEAARRLELPGTPTIRIDGVDVERGARGSAAASLKPRMYIRAGMITGCPSRGLILDGILEAKQRSRGQ